MSTSSLRFFCSFFSVQGVVKERHTAPRTGACVPAAVVRSRSRCRLRTRQARATLTITNGREKVVMIHTPRSTYRLVRRRGACAAFEFKLVFWFRCRFGNLFPAASRGLRCWSRCAYANLLRRRGIGVGGRMNAPPSRVRLRHKRARG